MSFLKEMVVFFLNLILSTVDFRVKFLYDRNLWALTNTHFWIFLKKKEGILWQGRKLALPWSND